MVERAVEPLPRLAFSVAECAEIIGCSPDLIRSAIRGGHLAIVPCMGRRQLVARKELERFLDQGVDRTP